MGIIATWLVGFPTFIFGVPYPLPLRGYILVDVSTIPTTLTSGEQGTTSTQGRNVRLALSWS